MIDCMEEVNHCRRGKIRERDLTNVRQHWIFGYRRRNVGNSSGQPTSSVVDGINRELPPEPAKARPVLAWTARSYRILLCGPVRVASLRQQAGLASVACRRAVYYLRVFHQFLGGLRGQHLPS